MVIHETIFQHWIFTDYLLPWLLVFVLIFAILEKTNILGEGKQQINAIIGLICACILLAFPFSREVIIGLIPFLVIVAVIIFVFLLLYGFVSGEKKGDPLGRGVKITIGIVIVIALSVAVLVVTKTWDNVVDFMTNGSNLGANLLFIIIAIAAVVAILFGSGKSSDKKKDED